MTKRLIVSVLLGLVACAGESLSVDLSSATVELDVFSGLPNPRWQLSPADLSELESVLNGLPETGPVEIPGQLGYRGFRIHDAGADRITVTNHGYVVVHHNSGDKFYRDTKDVERWLKANAEARGYAQLLKEAH